MNVSGKKMVAITASCFITTLNTRCRVVDHRHDRMSDRLSRLACASAAALEAVGRYVRNIRVWPAEGGQPGRQPSGLPHVIVVLAVVVRRLFLAAGGGHAG
jgi:hypothetical protein